MRSPLPLVEEPACALPLVSVSAVTVLLLQIANDREDRAVRDWSTAAATKRFGNARPDAAEASVACAASRGPETAGGAGFGGFEALFDGCELGFEAGKVLVEGFGRKRGGVGTGDSQL